VGGYICAEDLLRILLLGYWFVSVCRLAKKDIKLILAIAH
jgi:hypothetical protein